MQLEIEYRVVRPSAIVPIIPILDRLRLDGKTGMWQFLKDVRKSPAYMEGNARVALAYYDELVVGWATVCLDARCRVRFNVFVEEFFRRHGIGSELLRKLSEVYEEIAEVPPTVDYRYLPFFIRAIPKLLKVSSKQAHHLAR